jgi:small-conductance mechanosensitive channel
VPFWLALTWIALLLNWQWSLRTLMRSLHLIEDLVLQRQLFAKIEKPFKILLLTLAVLPLLHFLPPALGSILEKLAGLTLPLLSLYVFVTTFDTFFFTWYLSQRKEKNVPTVLRFVVLCLVYLIFGLLFLEWAFGVNVLPLIATSTVLTAVLGLSLQDTLKNLFAGLTMSFERRFKEGDWIMFRLDATNSTVGEVEELGWRTTKLRTIDNNFAVIPNAMFTSSQLINYSQPTPAFPKVIEIPVNIATPLDQIEQCLSEAASQTEGVLKDPAPEVLVAGVRTDHLLFKIRFWVGTYKESEPVASALIQNSYKKLTELQAIPAIRQAAITH